MTTRRLSPWRVEIEAHKLAERWSIEAQVFEPIYAINEIQARIQASRELHRRAGVPPWRPLLRRTYVRTTATPIKIPIKIPGARS
jgi:hypothetical protein